MNWHINFPIAPWQHTIAHQHSIMLVGSCFTENMGKKLAERKFATCQNPHGILFNPVSVHHCLRDVVEQRQYGASDLFFLNEQWHSWHHHSRFSHANEQQCLAGINSSIQAAHHFLKKCNWLVLTLGSAFVYRHTELDMHVSNNHRGPAQWFQKELLEIEYIQQLLQKSIDSLLRFNPALQIIFTISPVRHLRDGVVDNNRSKARLIEAVHSCIEKKSSCHYFPSYEIVIDELRDYRFYDIDYAHPNYTATQYVWERFVSTAIDGQCHSLLDELYKLHIAMQHRSTQPESNAHQEFLQSHYQKCQSLQAQHTYLDMSQELAYFASR